MKKLILSMIISIVPISTISAGVFHARIPQPDFISNDWDGDDIINSLDDDDDGDGIKDIDDSMPFGGRPGGESSVGLASSWKVEKVLHKDQVFNQSGVSYLHFSETHQKLYAAAHQTTKGGYVEFDYSGGQLSDTNSYKQYPINWVKTEFSDNYMIFTPNVAKASTYMYYRRPINGFGGGGSGYKGVLYQGMRDLDISDLGTETIAAGIRHPYTVNYRINPVTDSDKSFGWGDIKSLPISELRAALKDPTYSHLQISDDHQWVFVKLGHSYRSGVGQKQAIAIFKRGSEDNFSYHSYIEHPADIYIGGFANPGAFYSDGSTLIVGSSAENERKGAVHIYKLSGDTWTHSQIITTEYPELAVVNDAIGSANKMAVSPNYKYLVLGKANRRFKPGSSTSYPDTTNAEIWTLGANGQYEFLYDIINAEGLKEAPVTLDILNSFYIRDNGDLFSGSYQNIIHFKAYK